jgi:hypothetical protein
MGLCKQAEKESHITSMLHVCTVISYKGLHLVSMNGCKYCIRSTCMVQPYVVQEVVTCNELLEVWMKCRGPSQLLVLMLDCSNSNLWVTALSARHPAQRVVLSCAVQAVDAGDDCRTGKVWLLLAGHRLVMHGVHMLGCSTQNCLASSCLSQYCDKEIILESRDSFLVA